MNRFPRLRRVARLGRAALFWLLIVALFPAVLYLAWRDLRAHDAEPETHGDQGGMPTSPLRAAARVSRDEAGA